MHLDILIFAAIAAFLIWRLNSVLGARHGDERQRPNPFSPQETKPRPVSSGVRPVSLPQSDKSVGQILSEIKTLVDASANKDGRIENGLAEISAADTAFEVGGFMQGARYAFEMIVTAYAKGELETLKSLVSPKLFSDFEAGLKARKTAGHTSEVIIHRIKAARITEAHLGGTMAYITVDYDVEETTATRDASGAVVDGSPDRVFSIEDVWTFTRDIRSSDPNWILIETRAVEK